MDIPKEELTVLSVLRRLLPKADVTSFVVRGGKCCTVGIRGTTVAWLDPNTFTLIVEYDDDDSLNLICKVVDNEVRVYNMAGALIAVASGDINTDSSLRCKLGEEITTSEINELKLLIQTNSFFTTVNHHIFRIGKWCYNDCFVYIRTPEKTWVKLPR
jgi:hypothetical protein